ncbi:MAG: hypothetical protein HY054_09070 [Proteobacteria bacterium]|nr:hypothetical protein [Pseudomonadota bacterium]
MTETAFIWTAVAVPLLILFLVFAVFPSKALVRLLAGVSAIGFMAMNLSIATFNYERSGGRSDIFIAYAIYAAIAGGIVWVALSLLLGIRNGLAPPFRASRFGKYFLIALCGLWICLACLAVGGVVWLGIAHLEPAAFMNWAFPISLLIYGGCAIIAGIGLMKIRRNLSAMAHYAPVKSA